MIRSCRICEERSRLIRPKLRVYLQFPQPFWELWDIAGEGTNTLWAVNAWLEEKPSIMGRMEKKPWLNDRMVPISFELCIGTKGVATFGDDGPSIAGILLHTKSLESFMK
jgi:hypothetical protein